MVALIEKGHRYENAQDSESSCVFSVAVKDLK